MREIEKLFTLQNLLAAYYKASRGKKYKLVRMEFEKRREINLIKIRNEIIFSKYVPLEYQEFVINDSKKRNIKAPSFRDMIVQHTLHNYLYKIFDKRFIFDSYACRKNKGVHKAILKVHKIITNRTRNGRENLFYLKMDITKYFASIDHKILSSLIEDKIFDKEIVQIVKIIINSSYDFDQNGRKTGVPIGNLTSQLFANVYLDKLDWYIKKEMGHLYYVRYMDDFIMFSKNLSELKEVRDKIIVFLRDKLKLSAHPRKIVIMPCSEGVSFLGFRLFVGGFRKIRKNTIKKWRNKIDFILKKGDIINNNYCKTFYSWFGWIGYLYKK